MARFAYAMHCTNIIDGELPEEFDCIHSNEEQTIGPILHIVSWSWGPCHWVCSKSVFSRYCEVNNVCGYYTIKENKAETRKTKANQHTKVKMLQKNCTKDRKYWEIKDRIWEVQIERNHGRSQRSIGKPAESLVICIKISPWQLLTELIFIPCIQDSDSGLV